MKVAPSANGLPAAPAACPLPMIGPASSYSRRGCGLPADVGRDEAFMSLVRMGRGLACGRFAHMAAFYETFPKDAQCFLIAARMAFIACVATGDEWLFDRVRADIEAYPERYASPSARIGSRIMRIWIEDFLGGSDGKTDYMREFSLADFPADWRYAVALLMMKLLYGSGEYLAAWGVSELLLNLAPTDPAADVHIKLTRALICQDMGRMDDADRYARQAIEVAREKSFVLPFLGRLLGPKSPVEKNLRAFAPLLHERVRQLSGAYFRGYLKLHNYLTGDRCAENLTPREFYVARSLVRGLTYKEIALRLGIAYSRVNEIVTQLHEKLDVRKTAEMKPLVW